MWYSGSVGSSRAKEKLMYSWSQRLDYYLSSDFCYSVCWQTKLTPEKISQALFPLVTKLSDLLFFFFHFLLTIFSVLHLTISSGLGDCFAVFNFQAIFFIMNSSLKIPDYYYLKKLYKPLNSVDPHA